jgi:drug/metabolite transporter (DMT)-like permease
MVTILALAAATLYGSADFLGGAAARRAHPLSVLAVTAPAGALVMVFAAVLEGGAGGGMAWGGMTWASAGWAAAGGTAGALGLIAFYAGFAAAPMSVVAPVTALVATVLPVGVALVDGERLTSVVAAGAVICVAAVILVSMERPGERAGEVGGGRPGLSARLRAVGYAVPAGAAFGMFFLFLRDAGQYSPGVAGVVWPVTIARAAGTVVALTCCLALRVPPAGWRPDRAAFGIAVTSGIVDAAANVCYVLATRTGLFGLAVVITSLYPGVTVLLARSVFGERMRWVQQAGLVLAGIGVALVTV